MTGILSASGPNAIRRNAIALPAYSLMLGLIALMGYMAHAAGVKVDNPQEAVPQLFLRMFPDWFVGFTFAAIAIGALVPAAVMSIGAANTFTRNVWKAFVEPDVSASREAFLAKLVSLIVKIGALAVILFMPTQFALDLQLLGGVWMVQIFPALIFGLYTRWFDGWALFIGWAVGMVAGTYVVWGPKLTPLFPLWDGFTVYAGLYAFLLNLSVAVVLSFIMKNVAPDATAAVDFEDATASS
jgi:solute:Na+ symporter, SSS family